MHDEFMFIHEWLPKEQAKNLRNAAIRYGNQNLKTTTVIQSISQLGELYSVNSDCITLKQGSNTHIHSQLKAEL